MIQSLTSRVQEWGLNQEIFLLGMARAADSFGASMMIVLIPLFVRHFDVSFMALPSALVIGVILSIYGFTNTTLQPAVGVVIDRLGTNKLFISLGLVLYSVATGLFAVFNTFTWLAGLRILQGIGVALTIPPSMTLMTEYTEPSSRSTAMSFYNVMRMIGFATGPIVGGYLLTWFSFTPIIYLAAATGLLGAFLVQLLVQEIETPERTQTSGLFSDFGAYWDPEMAQFLKLALANVAMALSISLVAPLENEFNIRLDQTPADFGLAFSSLIFTLVIVQIPIGRLADIFGRKRIILIGLAILIPSTIFMGYLTTTTQFILTRMVQGVGVACVAAPSFALGGDKSSRGRRGREMSLLTMAFGLGIALGPLSGGFFAGKFSFETPFLLGGTLLLASAALVAWGVSPSRLVEDNKGSRK
jgi:MFS family permease